MKKVKCRHCGKYFDKKTWCKHRWYLENIEKCRKKSRDWIRRNKTIAYQKARKWAIENPERVKQLYKKFEQTTQRKRYRSVWRKKNKDRLNEARRKYYWNKGRKRVLETNNRYFDKAHYNGFWKKCLERDHYTCQKCSDKNNVQVHHLRYGDDVGLKDLITLCVGCHMSLHAKERNKNLSGSYKS